MKDRKAEIIDELSLWAERYAIERISYANQSTARTLREVAEAGYLTDKTIQAMIDDIDAAIWHDKIPYDDQVRDWGELREALIYQLSPREYI